MVDAVALGAFGLDVGQVPEVIRERRRGRSVKPRPERRLAHRDHARPGHVEVIVGCTTDAMDMGVDVLHPCFAGGGDVMSEKIICTLAARSGSFWSRTLIASRSFARRGSVTSRSLPPAARSHRSISAASERARQRISKNWSLRMSRASRAILLVIVRIAPSLV